MSGRYNFPSWNYGYTLGPPSAATGGDYTQYYAAANANNPMMNRGGGGGVPRGGPSRGRPPFRGRGGLNNYGNFKRASNSNTATPTPASEVVTAATEADKKEEKKELDDSMIPPPPEAPDKKEDGEIIERSMTDILKGRNPIMFCNDQSKLRGLHMEWEQVSETGPPHDKIFTWSLKMGDMQCSGSANSKKGAKNSAAEEMVKKLDLLPKVNKRNFYQQGGGFRGGPPPHPHMMRGGRGGRGGCFFGQMPPPNFYQAHNNKRRKVDNDTAKVAATTATDTAKVEEKKVEEQPQPLHPAQNNPISKLYEFSKKRKQPEPMFETVSEEILETRKTQAGFTYKKTLFTIQCEIMGKKYVGSSHNKKQAKFNAAAVAWAEVGAGVGQASIDSLLQSGRNASNAQS